MTRGNYNTKQKDKILNIIKKFGREFTVKEVYDKACDYASLTTIYRFIDKMMNDEVLNKYVALDGNTYYQFIGNCTCGNHFYLKCNKCGKLIHVNCDCVEELNKQINEQHGFIPNDKRFIINGICRECKGE